MLYVALVYIFGVFGVYPLGGERQFLKAEVGCEFPANDFRGVGYGIGFNRALVVGFRA